MKKSIVVLFSLLFVLAPLFAASPITFSGGSTSIEKTGDTLSVVLTGGATVDTGDMSLKADEVSIWGEGYRYVRCTGSVSVSRPGDGITLFTPGLFFDRDDESLLVDSWIEIQDTKNQVALSGAHLEYSLSAGIMKLQIQARILKDTDDGQLRCSADSIIYDSNNQTLTLQGKADVTWGEDSYKASSITIDLKTNDLKMEGQISGTVNG